MRPAAHRDTYAGGVRSYRSSEGKTVMKLKQTGIPEEDDYGNANTVEVTLQGWRMQIWGRVRQCFGYGC